MKIQDQTFGGERPLFGSHNLEIENVLIEPGESALKECSDIVARKCEFQGRYPFWHVDRFEIDDCIFREEARAALWYSRGMVMRDTLIEAPKTLREMQDIELYHVRIPAAIETLWHVNNVKLRDVEVEGAEYIFFHSQNIDIDGYRQKGKYSFQYCKNIVVRNAVLDTKDAFWETENVTIIDSVVKGEYLGWHSKNLKLINCHISGTQPLCYATDLVLENCTMDKDCDLAFEYSSVQATINGAITSVKNPITGFITADEIDEIILDENLWQPGDCKITVRG